MRTVFEDTNEVVTPDAPKSGQSLPILLWAVAILFLVGAFAVYRFVSNRIVLPPPPAIAVNDPKQVNELLYKFNQLIKEGNFDQAQAMLSADAQKKLTDSQKTFRETFLAQRKGKDEKVIEAVPLTENVVALSDDSVTIGVTYYFDKNETIYIPLTITKETVGDSQRLAISDWEEKKEETKTENATASPSPEAKKSESPAPEKK
jgi:flagellar basal body-associated protein FliL